MSVVPDAANHPGPVRALAYGFHRDGRELKGLYLGRQASIQHVDHILAARIAFRKRDTDLFLVRFDEADGELERLLKAAQADSPQMLRVLVCSEDQDRKRLLRWLPLAHQSVALGTPGGAAALHSALRVLPLLKHAPTRELVGAHNRLPAAPRVYQELQEALRDPAVTNLRLAEVIERDVGLSARLVQLVSSAFFGLPRQISSLGGCIAYLGHTTVVSLVLAAEVERTFDGSKVPNFSAEKLQQSGLLAARVAKKVAAGTGQEEDAFIAALFHAVGQLVLASREPVRFSRALRTSATDGIKLTQAEEKVFGTNHAQVGAYLLALWGLPSSVVEGVLFHETPRALGAQSLTIAGAVYVAHILAEKADAEMLAENTDGSVPWLDRDFLQELGVSDSVARWREWARGA